MKKRFVCSVILLVSLFFWGQIEAVTFSNIVAFGDSLSDNGNMFSLTAGYTPDSQHYYEGRYSNGRVWVEYLADLLQLSGALDDRAYGGATSGGTLPPGLKIQVQTFVVSHTLSQNSLVTVWIGGNDYIYGSGNYATAVSNLLDALEMLAQAGARHILVMNLPNLGAIPRFNGSSATSSSALAFTTNFNESLRAVLTTFTSENPSVALYSFDAFSMFEELHAHPATYGFSNVENTNPDYGVSFENQGKYVFWDDIHPTTEAHSLIANQVATFLRTAIPGNVSTITTNLTGAPHTNDQVQVSFQAQGVGASLYYQYWVASGYQTTHYGNWQLIKPWSTDTAVTWTPNTDDHYVLVVWVADNPGSQIYHQAGLSVETGGNTSNPIQILTLTTDMGYPQPVSTPINLSTSATGGNGLLYYKYFSRPGEGGWTVIREWAANNVTTWTPGQAGTYTVVVWVSDDTTATEPPLAGMTCMIGE